MHTFLLCGPWFRSGDKKRIGEHAHIVAGVAQEKMKNKNFLKAIRVAKGNNTNLIKLGIMKASAKLHLLRGADGYRFWKREVEYVLQLYRFLSHDDMLPGINIMFVHWFVCVFFFQQE